MTFFDRIIDSYCHILSSLGVIMTFQGMDITAFVDADDTIRHYYYVLLSFDIGMLIVAIVVITMFFICAINAFKMRHQRVLMSELIDSHTNDDTFDKISALKPLQDAELHYRKKSMKALVIILIMLVVYMILVLSYSHVAADCSNYVTDLLEQFADSNMA